MGMFFGALAWIGTKLGPKGIKIFWIVLVALLALVIVFGAGRCAPDDDASEQAEQTNRSGAAIADAAGEAVKTITKGVATEQAIDDAVEDATKGINDAQTVDAIHAIVVDSVCGSPAHRRDPACRVPQAGAR